MAAFQVNIKVHKKEFDLWARNMRTVQIKRVEMKALKKAGFKVMKAEQREIKRVFNKRPNTGGFIARSIRYVPVESRTQVWVGPLRPNRSKTGKPGRVGSNVAKIIADHTIGASYSGASTSPRGENATRLRTQADVAVPLPPLSRTRGKTGKLKFSSVRHGLSAKETFGSPRMGLTPPTTPKSFVAELKFKKGKRKVLAVRSNRPMATPRGPWGYPNYSSGLRKGKRAVSVKHPYIIPLFILLDKASVKKRIRFYQIAKATAPRAVAEAFRKEFNRGVPISKSLGVTPTVL